MEPDAASRPTSSLRTLISRLAPFRGALTVVLLLELGTRAAALIQPLAARAVVDGVAARADLMWPIAVLGAVAIIGLCLNYAGFYQRGKLSERFVLGLRKAMAGRIVGAPVSYVESRSTADLVSRVGADSTLIQQTTVKALVDLVVVPLTVVAGIVLMLTIDVFLALVVIVLLSVAGLAEAGVFRRVVVDTETAQEHVAGLTGVVQRVLLAFRTVKASRSERREAESFDRNADSAYRASVKAVRTGALADTVAYAAVDFTFLVTLAVGVVRVSTGSVGVGDLVAILLYVVYIQEPVEALTNSAGKLSEGLAALRRITELLDAPQETDTAAAPARTEVPAVSNGSKPPASRRSVRFDQVWFGYGDQPVLRDVSIEAVPGLTVLVGSSGAGKTTLLSLAERFVEPERGAVLLDGADVRDLPLAELRGRVAYVQQEAPLLGATIGEAATYGVDDVDEERLRRILESVGLRTWIEGLPLGLDTEVGERGVQISGGQRQRLAVARALARDSEVLLLDEATSQLDPLNEQNLVRSLTRDFRDRVVIAVTHRMPMAYQADQVIMLRHGSVHARGTHDDLLSDPHYRQLIASPSAGSPELAEQLTASGEDGRGEPGA
ncbi:ATP-binding cassette subfamily C protein [Saccharopolyspora erythraea NRRL 2338]|uniref:Multidrug ABC transporter, ATP-binding protein n=2 Tax=Saccharopolyspora erythraea TaxID=1836 RepID=A4F7C2_SACEN|nr:ABC transporter ATP-binding protein [Saccharopolyspora erythraea]EQD83617.1 multidrug ABC transporter ATP-binding protein [Saccharopolyspora erythraea D]PFG93748.1 ATP-binding cassette subfamily C protein [Saccharopolyspora erythraea NRRL 2338]QRK90585.1 ABC transporter ATP-binding protein [Saccharopolyspora erythraea]CAL99946.1 multidrug ABC transporter, ATP-binding protein [Saccharopolyspora erythraea NRRL 2338]